MCSESNEELIELNRNMIFKKEPNEMSYRKEDLIYGVIPNEKITHVITTEHDIEEDKDDHLKISSHKQDLSIFEKIESCLIICPNSFMFQVWAFLITLLGTGSSLFYVFCAVIRKDLEEWEPLDDNDHQRLLAYI